MKLRFIISAAWTLSHSSYWSRHLQIRAEGLSWPLFNDPEASKALVSYPTFSSVRAAVRSNNGCQAGKVSLAEPLVRFVWLLPSVFIT
jgi:hypothetical protein